MPDSTLEVVRHPLIEHKLSFLRDKDTGSRQFRALLEEVTLLLTFHATRHLKGDEATLDTPLETMRARRIREDRLVVVPILRAGLGMVEGVLRLDSGRTRRPPGVLSQRGDPSAGSLLRQAAPGTRHDETSCWSTRCWARAGPRLPPRVN